MAYRMTVVILLSLFHLLIYQEDHSFRIGIKTGFSLKLLTSLIKHHSIKKLLPQIMKLCFVATLLLVVPDINADVEITATPAPYDDQPFRSPSL